MNGNEKRTIMRILDLVQLAESKIEKKMENGKEKQPNKTGIWAKSDWEQPDWLNPDWDCSVPLCYLPKPSCTRTISHGTFIKNQTFREQDVVWVPSIEVWWCFLQHFVGSYFFSSFHDCVSVLWLFWFWVETDNIVLYVIVYCMFP